jgi:hypothetical protein
MLTFNRLILILHLLIIAGNPLERFVGAAKEQRNQLPGYLVKQVQLPCVIVHNYCA